MPGPWDYLAREQIEKLYKASAQIRCAVGYFFEKGDQRLLYEDTVFILYNDGTIDAPPLSREPIAEIKAALELLEAGHGGEVATPQSSGAGTVQGCGNACTGCRCSD
jgi:hypothetical protein